MKTNSHIIMLDMYYLLFSVILSYIVTFYNITEHYVILCNISIVFLQNDQYITLLYFQSYN